MGTVVEWLSRQIATNMLPVGTVTAVPWIAPAPVPGVLGNVSLEETDETPEYSSAMPTEKSPELLDDTVTVWAPAVALLLSAVARAMKLLNCCPGGVRIE